MKTVVRVILVVCFLLLSLSAFAEAPFVEVPLRAGQALPTTLYIKKGTALKFTGDLSKDILSLGIEIRMGSRVCTQGEYKNHIELTWDPSEQLGTAGTISVYTVPTTREHFLLGKIHIEILSDTPLELSLSQVKDIWKTTDAVITPKGTLKAEHIDFLFDDQPSANTLQDSGGKATLDITGLKPGTHTVRAKAVFPDKGLYLSEYKTFEITPKVFMPLEKTVIDLNGDTEPVQDLALRVKVDEEIKPASYTFLVDDKPVEAKASADGDQARSSYVFNPRSLSGGKHNFCAVVTDAEGKRYLSADMPFQVIPNWLRLLAVQVPKYNDLLMKAQDAYVNQVAAYKVYRELQREAASFSAASNVGQDYEARAQASLDKSFRYRRDIRDNLEQALELYKTIHSNPRFSTNYAEGNLCLTYGELPIGMETTGADHLHFLHRL